MKPLRLLLIFIVLLGLAFVVHLLIHKTYFSYQHVSDALFVVGIVMFLPTVGVITGSFEIFQGIGYAFRVLISPNYRHQYPTFKDYKDVKNVKIKTGFFYELLIASLVLVIAAAILAGMATR